MPGARLHTNPVAHASGLRAIVLVKTGITGRVNLALSLALGTTLASEICVAPFGLGVVPENNEVVVNDGGGRTNAPATTPREVAGAYSKRRASFAA